jgi:hypothetical protein
MSYYQSSEDVVIYEPNARCVTITDNLKSGMSIRFSHPEYSRPGEKALERLFLNGVYIVDDYKIYLEGLSFTLVGFPGIHFDHKMFTLATNNYIIPYGRRRTRFFIEKVRMRVRRWWCKT